jgi:hypothetical protein
VSYYNANKTIVVKIAAPDGNVYLTDGPWFSGSTSSPALTEAWTCIKSISDITARLDGGVDGDIDLYYHENIESLFSQALPGVELAIYRVDDPGEALSSSNQFGRYTVKSLGASSTGGLFIRVGSYKDAISVAALNWSNSPPYSNLYDSGNATYRPRAYCRGAMCEVWGHYDSDIAGVAGYWVSTHNTEIYAVHHSDGATLSRDQAFNVYNPDNSPVWSSPRTTTPKVGRAFWPGATYRTAELGGESGLTVWDLLNDLLTQLSSQGFSIAASTDAQTTLDALDARRIGMFIRSGEAAGTHIDELLNCYGYRWGFDGNGELFVFKIQEPVGASVDVTLTADDVVIDSVTPQRLELQASSFTVRSGWSELQLDEQKVEWTLEWNGSDVWTNGSPSSDAQAATLDTKWDLLYTGSPGFETSPETWFPATEAVRRGKIRENVRQIYRAQVWNFSGNIGSIINITYPRDGFESGRNGLIHSVTQNPYTNISSIEFLV